MRILRDDRFAYLRRRHLLLFFEFQRQQRFANANVAVRRMIVFKTTIEALVSKALIAVAVTRQLRNGHRYLSHCAIRIASDAAKRFGTERWCKARLAWRHCKMRRHSLRRSVR